MSREELIALVAERDAQIATLSTQVADLARANERLAAKLARLEHLLSRNSQNSSLPPSRDDDLGRTSPALKCCPAPARSCPDRRPATVAATSSVSCVTADAPTWPASPPTAHWPAPDLRPAWTASRSALPAPRRARSTPRATSVPARPPEDQT